MSCKSSVVALVGSCCMSAGVLALVCAWQTCEIKMSINASVSLLERERVDFILFPPGRGAKGRGGWNSAEF